MVMKGFVMEESHVAFVAPQVSKRLDRVAREQIDKLSSLIAK